MAIEDTLIVQGIEALVDWIDEIGIPVVIGLINIVLVLVTLWFVGYVILYQGILGEHWVRGLALVGLWLLLEVAHYFGGGHSKSRHYTSL